MMKTQKIKVIGDNPAEWLFNQKINFELFLLMSLHILTGRALLKRLGPCLGGSGLA